MYRLFSDIEQYENVNKITSKINADILERCKKELGIKN